MTAGISSFDPGKKLSASSVTVFMSTGWQRPGRGVRGGRKRQRQSEGGGETSKGRERERDEQGQRDSHPPNLSFSKANVLSMAPQHASEADSEARHEEKAMIKSLVEFWRMAAQPSAVFEGTPNTGLSSPMSWMVTCAFDAAVGPTTSTAATSATRAQKVVAPAWVVLIVDRVVAGFSRPLAARLESSFFVLPRVGRLVRAILHNPPGRGPFALAPRKSETGALEFHAA